MVFLVFPRFQMLDLAGPLEVFAQADSLFHPDRRRYQTEVVALDPEPVTATNGLAVVPQGTMADAATLPVDTLVVVGGFGVRQAMRDPVYLDWVRAMAARARRVTSVCSGAFLLAAAGLLDGRRAVTHWSSCEELARSFPGVHVEADPIFVRSDPVWTSAGITAGLDLAMALVEDDHGAEVARRIAKQLVVFVQRSGGQAQFSDAAGGAAARRRRAVCGEVAGVDGGPSWTSRPEPAEPLARRAALSARHFAARVHGHETRDDGGAPIVAAAASWRRRGGVLEQSAGDGVDADRAYRAGSAAPRRLRRAFNRSRCGCTPSAHTGGRFSRRTPTESH